jgi:hypothetical protein
MIGGFSVLSCFCFWCGIDPQWQTRRPGLVTTWPRRGLTTHKLLLTAPLYRHMSSSISGRPPALVLPKKRNSRFHVQPLRLNRSGTLASCPDIPGA